MQPTAYTQRGYDYAAKVINEAGGVKVGVRAKLAIKYYDDESTPARGVIERLIQQDGVEYAWPI